MNEDILDHAWYRFVYFDRTSTKFQVAAAWRAHETMITQRLK